ncbi:MAG: hypothetical protein RLZZ59_813 [Pseudomonadota bacterium]|jgi:hypothetical protein
MPLTAIERERARNISRMLEVIAQQQEAPPYRQHAAGIPIASRHLSNDEKALDSMATIVGAGHVVGAVCWDETRNAGRGGFLVATNDGNGADPTRRFQIFRDIANNVPGSEERLKGDVYTHASIGDNNSNNRRLREDTVRNLRQTIRNNLVFFIDNPDIKQDFNLVIDNLERYHPDIREASRAAQNLLHLSENGGDASTRLHDILVANELAQRIAHDPNGLTGLLTDVARPRQNVDRAVAYIRAYPDNFRQPETFLDGGTVNTGSPPNSHAEMKIIAALGGGRNPVGGPDKYIGNTKMCCAACGIAIDAVTQRANNDGHNLRYNTGGRHNKMHATWEVPDFIAISARTSHYMMDRMTPMINHGPDPANPSVKQTRRLSIDEHADAVVAALRHATVPPSPPPAVPAAGQIPARGPRP